MDNINKDKINLDRWVIKKWKTYTKWNFEDMKTDVRLDDLKFKYDNGIENHISNNKNKTENERNIKENSQTDVS